MKRYNLGVNWNSTGHPEPCAKEMSAKKFILFDDHAALLRAVAEEVGKLPHEKKCAHDKCVAIHYSGGVCGWPEHYWAHEPDGGTHSFVCGECNCPRGKVLAMLEVE